MFVLSYALSLNAVTSLANDKQQHFEGSLGWPSQVRPLVISQQIWTLC